MNRRVMLAFAAAGVIAAAVILYLALNTDDTPAVASASTEPAARTEQGASSAGGASQPSLPGSDPSGRDGASARPPVREYVTEDGRRVRDHRRHPPQEGSAREPKPPVRMIANTVTANVGTGLKKVMSECLKDLPRRAPGAKPARLQGELIVSIKDRELKVDEAKLAISQLEGDVVTAAMKCMQEKSVGISTAAPDEPDLEKSSIRIDLALP